MSAMAKDPDDDVLPMCVAVDLAHALVQYTAVQEGVAVLFIKGPVANHHRLQPDRVSSDVDVLVHPGDQAALVTALTRRGWRVRPASLAHERFITHSVNLLHPSWPCDIDVHDSYPGFFVDRAEANAIAMVRSERLGVAGHELTVADFELSALISALHSLRSLHSRRHLEELDAAVREVRRRLATGETSADDLVRLVTTLGGVEASSPFFRRLEIELDLPPEPSHDFLLWRLRAAQRSRLASWLVEIADAPMRERVALTKAALLPPRQDMLVDHPRAAESRFQLLRAHLERLRDAVTATPEALRAFRAERASRRSERLDRHWMRTSPGGQATQTQDPALSGTPSALVEASRGLHEETPGRPVGLPSRTGQHGEVMPVGGRGITRTSRISIRSDAAAVSYDGDVFVLAMSRSDSMPMRLAGPAAELWHRIGQAKPRTLDSLITSVAAVYGLPADDILQDVRSFVELLVEHAVIVVEN